MKQDAESYVKRCDRCQRHALILRVPSEAFNSITSPLPFAQWEMDIVGSFSIATAQKKFLLFATYYFSKWMETKSYASIKDKDVSKFV
ncbi:hypothetical protein CK203_113072 [Vitis vinifera]|uniref:Integrase zinc-binding domain-containing protein n=1 Tax=Vitis vinifera TaxID=29760 RepID=A0A438FH47_VITVI|nr:hypothetical protein CK203_113072 [Vitis vinifera]